MWKKRWNMQELKLMNQIARAENRPNGRPTVAFLPAYELVCLEKNGADIMASPSRVLILEESNDPENDFNTPDFGLHAHL